MEYFDRQFIQKLESKGVVFDTESILLTMNTNSGPST